MNKYLQYTKEMIIGLFLAVIVHECGHVLVFALFGHPTIGFQLLYEDMGYGNILCFGLIIMYLHERSILECFLELSSGWIFNFIFFVICLHVNRKIYALSHLLIAFASIFFTMEGLFYWIILLRS